jgi:hypothetical protein
MNIIKQQDYVKYNARMKLINKEQIGNKKNLINGDVLNFPGGIIFVMTAENTEQRFALIWLS